MKELSKAVFPAIRLFIATIRGEDAASRIKFTSADINMEDPKHPTGVLVVWGNSIFNAGEEVMDDDKKMVTITEKQAMFLSTPLQVSIPVDRVVRGDIKELMAFLHEVFKGQMQHMQQLQQQLEKQDQEQNTPGDLQTEYMYNMLNELDNPEEEVPDLDMDLSDFSKEEQYMIRLSHKKSGGTLQ